MISSFLRSERVVSTAVSGWAICIATPWATGTAGSAGHSGRRGHSPNWEPAPVWATAVELVATGSAAWGEVVVDGLALGVDQLHEAYRRPNHRARARAATFVQEAMPLDLGLPEELVVDLAMQC